MDLSNLLAALNAGQTITAGSPLHEAMHYASQQALRSTCKLNSQYHSPEAIVRLMSEITGKDVDPSFRLFPPFYTDFGLNITLGRNVFINSCCQFQDQGGIVIGNGALIGHHAVLTTLNHDLDPLNRGDMHPAPVVIGDHAWLGANVTVLPGVTIGDGAIVGAGSVVTHDVPEMHVVVGNPARTVRTLEPSRNEISRQQRSAAQHEAPPGPAASPGMGSAVDTERSILKNWQSQLIAMDTADIDLLAAQFTPDAELVHLTGMSQPLADWLSGIAAGEFVYHRVVPRQVDVTITGDSAVLTGRIITGVASDGSGHPWRLQITQEFRPIDDIWLCAVSRVTTW